MSHWLMIILAIVILLLLLLTSGGKSQISGLLVVPSLPLLGNTLQVLNNPSQVFQKWADTYKSSIFVIHLGKTQAIVVNSWKDVQTIWGGHPLSTNSRPTLHTFHNIVSKTQGPTIGSTPYGASYRKLRKCISGHLTPKSLSQGRSARVINSCSVYILRSLVDQCLERTRDRNILRLIQGYVLRCAVHLCYGFELDTEHHDKKLTDTIIKTENEIVNLRSITSNYQDYLPLLWIPNYCFGKHNKLKNRRDAYMDMLHQRFQRLYSSESDSSESPFLLRMHNLNATERRSFCLTMVSAGLDNLALTFDHILGQLSLPTGEKVQDKLYRALMELYDNDIKAAWEQAAEKDCTYAIALIHEGLRSFTVLPMGLARTTTKPIALGEAFIPENSVILMNAYSANHDSSVFGDPYKFRPERWLDEEGKLLKGDALNHISFGLGSRRCAGDHLTIREMYLLLCRILLLFRISAPSDGKWQMIVDQFAANAAPRATSFEPREFRYSLAFRHSKSITLSLLSNAQPDSEGSI